MDNMDWIVLTVFALVSLAVFVNGLRAMKKAGLTDQ